MAEPASTSVVIPAFNEAAGIAAVVAGVRQVGPWREILVIDDGSTDATADLARGAGARVLNQPYNKGLGAAIKRGVRAAAGTHVLIMDGDGQHRPEDARRLVARLGDYDLVVGARPAETQASPGRRLGNALLNDLASRLTAHPVADLTSGFRAARTALLREFLHMLPNGFSSAATITLAAIKAGYSVAFEPTAARRRQGSSKIRLRATASSSGCSCCAWSPSTARCASSCRSACCCSPAGSATRCGRSSPTATSPTPRSCWSWSASWSS